MGINHVFDMTKAQSIQNVQTLVPINTLEYFLVTYKCFLKEKNDCTGNCKKYP